MQAELRHELARGREVFGCERRFVGEVGPVIGAHAGPGMIGVGGLPADALRCALRLVAIVVCAARGPLVTARMKDVELGGQVGLVVSTTSMSGPAQFVRASSVRGRTAPSRGAPSPWRWC